MQLKHAVKAQESMLAAAKKEEEIVREKQHQKRQAPAVPMLTKRAKQPTDDEAGKQQCESTELQQQEGPGIGEEMVEKSQDDLEKVKSGIAEKEDNVEKNEANVEKGNMRESAAVEKTEEIVMKEMGDTDGKSVEMEASIGEADKLKEDSKGANVQDKVGVSDESSMKPETCGSVPVEGEREGALSGVQTEEKAVIVTSIYDEDSTQEATVIAKDEIQCTDSGAGKEDTVEETDQTSSEGGRSQVEEEAETLPDTQHIQPVEGESFGSPDSEDTLVESEIAVSASIRTASTEPGCDADVVPQSLRESPDAGSVPGNVLGS